MDIDKYSSGEKLQKVLAHAGVASRRAAEELIKSGRIKVNGELVTELGKRVSQSDKIEVDHQLVLRKHSLVYYLLNKPIGVITSVKDTHGRTTVIDLLKEVKTRIYPVGRLDFDTAGVLLLTNDGELAFRLTHPSYSVNKKYLVGVRGPIKESALETLARGVHLEDGITHPAKVRRLGTNSKINQIKSLEWIEIVIHEGRNRQVRRMFSKVGYPVCSLTRIDFGPIKLKNLKPGAYRKLTPGEIMALKSEVGL